MKVCVGLGIENGDNYAGSIAKLYYYVPKAHKHPSNLKTKVDLGTEG